MAYRLLVRSSLSRPDDRFSDLLKYWEIPRGENVDVTLTISNLSTEKFPGAKLRRLDMMAYEGTAYGITHPSNITELPSLPPDPSVSISIKFSGIMTSEGIWWITMEAEKANGQEVLFLKNEDSKGYSSYARAMFVVSRENLEIITLLRELIDKFHEKDKSV